MGQSAFVIGVTEQMGAWDPTRATRMTAEGIHPKWRNETYVNVNQDQAKNLQYKYIIHSDESTVWEQGDNRTVDLSSHFGTDEVMVVEDYWFDQMDC